MNINKSTVTAMAIGAAFGMIVGMLLLDGNITAGIAIGAAFGLLVGILAERLGHIPERTLTGIAEGISTGILLGLAAGYLHGAFAGQASLSRFVLLLGQPLEQGYIGIGLVAGATLGMVVGAVQEPRLPHGDLTAGD